MVYLKGFKFPTKSQELDFIHPPETMETITMRLHTGSFYPFEILPDKGLLAISFESITILYGGNGCGKTTALNVIAEKLHLKRDSLFNSGRFFSDYLDMCKYNEEDFRNYGQFLNQNSRIITSDDVFSFSMKKKGLQQTTVQQDTGC